MLLVVTLVLGAVLFYAGLGPTLINTFARPLDDALRALAIVFSITVVLDLALAPFIWLIEMGLTRMTGWKVEY